MSNHDIAVLIVDDELSQAEGLAEWLRRKEKVGVEIATSGESALDLLRQTPGKHDVVLLDQVFPSGWSGIETLQRIKAEFPRIFVVMLTQDAGEDGLEALRQGAYRYIIKPVVDNQEIGFLVRHVGEIRELERRLRLEHQLGEEAGQKAEQLTALLKHEQEISRLALFGDYDSLADYITLAVSDLTGTDVSLWVIEETPAGPTLRIKAGRGLSGDYKQTATLSLDPRKSMVAACLHKKHPVVKVDIFDDTTFPPFHYKRQAKIQGWRSFLAVPLLDSAERPLGALSVYSHQKRDFGDAEKNLLVAFANQAAIALETRIKQRSLEQLVLSGQIAMKEVSAEHEVLSQFVELARELTNAPCAAIYPYDPQQGEFYDATRVAVTGLIQRKKDVSRKPRRKGLAAIVRHTGLVVVHDLDAGDIDDIDYKRIQEQTPLDQERLLEIIRAEKFVKREKIKAFVGISLRATENTDVVQDQAEVGVLYINFRASHHFLSSELSLIQLFAQQVASLIRAARLRAGQQEQLRIRSILAEASSTIAQAGERDDIFKAVFKQAFRLTGKTTGSVIAVEADRRLRIVDCLDVSPENLAAFHSRPTYALEGSFGTVTRTGRIFESRNTAKDLKTGRMLDMGLPIPAQVTNVPLKCEGKVVGILVVDTIAPNSQIRDALLSLVEVGGIALERADRTRTLTDLNEAGKWLTAAAELGSVLRGVVDKARAILGADAITLYRYDGQNKDVIVPPTHAGLLHSLEPLHESGEFHTDNVAIKVIRSGKPHYAALARRDRLVSPARPAGATPNFVQRESIESSAAVPLRVAGDTVGLLFVNYRTPHNFGALEREKIELFASQAAVAIKNALRLEEERRLRAQADTLREVSRTISAKLKLDEAGKAILEGLGRVIEYHKASVQIIEGDSRKQIASAPSDAGTPPGYLLRPLSRDPLVTGIVVSKQPLIVSDLSDPTKAPKGWEYLPETEHIKSWAGVPLVYGDRTIGLLTLDHDTPGYYTETVRDLLVSFGNQAAIAIENARLYKDLSESMQREQAKADQLVHLHQVSETMMRTFDPNEIVPLVVKSVNQLLGSKASSVINLYDAAKGEFVSRYAGGLQKNALEKGLPRKEGGAGSTVLREGAPLFVEEAEGHYLTRPESLVEGIRSFACLPLIVGEERLGTLYTRFDEQHLFLIGL